MLDGAGRLKAALREDGASLAREDIAWGKANGCLAMGLAGRELARRAQAMPGFMNALSDLTGGRAVPVPGGVLVKDAQGAVLGAVGVSGDASDKDEACALAGVPRRRADAGNRRSARLIWTRGAKRATPFSTHSGTETCMLRIHGVARSRAFRCIWAAEEAGHPYEIVPLGFGARDKAEVLKVNPNGKIPALQDGGLTLFESLAINLHGAGKAGAKLMPTGDDASRGLQWTLWAATEAEPSGPAMGLQQLRPPAR